MRISLLQTAIAWAKPEVNLNKYLGLLSALKGKSDLAVLPEMCLSGFGAPAPKISETNRGKCIGKLREAAADYGLAVAGSFSALDEETKQYFNRGFFFTPDGRSFYYDKKHLFAMGDENKSYTAGNKQLNINYLGWNIRLIICYDLRFPLWCRNRHNEYDLLLVSANWPQARQKAWTTLLQARAIENLAYVCGVNCVGEDGRGIVYGGDSLLLDYKASLLSAMKNGREQAETHTLDLDALRDFRQKFPAWKDADDFHFSE